MAISIEHQYSPEYVYQHAPDYKYYAQVDGWTVDETASLLCDIQPGELEKHIVVKDRYAFVSSQTTPEDEEEYWMEMDSHYRLSKELILIALKVGKLQARNNQVHDAILDPIEVIKWAKHKPQITPSHRLIDAINALNPTANIQMEQTTALTQTSYTTPLIDAMHKAIKEFWLNHDPEDPPLGKTIIDWLVGNFKVSERQATAIDLIIRDPRARKGGNRKRKL
jgi:hypothetical protein